MKIETHNGRDLLTSSHKLIRDNLTNRWNQSLNQSIDRKRFFNIRYFSASIVMEVINVLSTRASTSTV